MSRGKIGISLGLLMLLGFVFLFNLDGIPFHPDETSLLFQSRDLELILNNPLALSYDPATPTDQLMEYRALNAPLAKYLLALGRRANGAGPETVSKDWDWQASWQENIRAGAMPSSEALLGGRAVSALLALLAVPFIFWAGYQLGGWPHAIAAAALYGFNGFVLLHGRRSMAEGSLLFFSSMLIPLAFIGKRRPSLAGLAAALTFASKHSALPLLIMPFYAIIRSPRKRRPREFQWRGLTLLLVTFLLTTFILNPFMWKHPISAVSATAEARLFFIEDQKLITEALAPGAVLDTPSQRFASLIGHSFILPIQFQEVGNYQAALASSIEVYRQNPLHHLLNGPIQGSLLLCLFILGIWGAWRGRPFNKPDRRKNHSILLMGTVAMAAATLLLNPLPYQRYYLPLIPLFTLWEATGFVMLTKGGRQLVAKIRRSKNGGFSLPSESP